MASSEPRAAASADCVAAGDPIAQRRQGTGGAHPTTRGTLNSPASGAASGAFASALGARQAVGRLIRTLERQRRRARVTSV